MFLFVAFAATSLRVRFDSLHLTYPGMHRTVHAIPHASVYTGMLLRREQKHSFKAQEKNTTTGPNTSAWYVFSEHL